MHLVWPNGIFIMMINVENVKFTGKLFDRHHQRHTILWEKLLTISIRLNNVHWTIQLTAH